jgi:hypothetical protein
VLYASGSKSRARESYALCGDQGSMGGRAMPAQRESVRGRVVVGRRCRANRSSSDFRELAAGWQCGP